VCFSVIPFFPENEVSGEDFLRVRLGGLFPRPSAFGSRGGSPMVPRQTPGKKMIAAGDMGARVRRAPPVAGLNTNISPIGFVPRTPAHPAAPDRVRHESSVSTLIKRQTGMANERIHVRRF
jgi:hypothetical protein